MCYALLCMLDDKNDRTQKSQLAKLQSNSLRIYDIANRRCMLGILSSQGYTEIWWHFLESINNAIKMKIKMTYPVYSGIFEYIKQIKFLHVACTCTSLSITDIVFKFEPTEVLYLFKF